MIVVFHCAGIKGWPIMACEMACSMLQSCVFAVERSLPMRANCLALAVFGNTRIF